MVAILLDATFFLSFLNVSTSPKIELSSRANSIFTEAGVGFHRDDLQLVFMITGASVRPTMAKVIGPSEPESP